MEQDLSYLRTDYAREKDLECYRIEEKEAEAKQKEADECKQSKQK